MGAGRGSENIEGDWKWIDSSRRELLRRQVIVEGRNRETTLRPLKLRLGSFPIRIIFRTCLCLYMTLVCTEYFVPTDAEVCRSAQCAVQREVGA